MGGRYLCCRCAPCCNTISIVVTKYKAHRLIVYSAFYAHGMQPGARMCHVKKFNGLSLQAISTSCLYVEAFVPCEEHIQPVSALTPKRIIESPCG